MIVDAVLAELAKLRRDGRLLFWGFLSVPCGFVLIQLTVMMFFRITIAVDVGAVDGVQNVSHALGIGQNLFAEVFLIGGAAGLFAGDYRWETWRYIVPRNGRGTLICGKSLVFVMGVAAVVCLVGCAAAVLSVVEALIWHHPMPGVEDFVASWRIITFAWLASVLKMSVWGAMAALMAVMSRSTVGTMASVSMVAFVEAVVADKMSGGLTLPAAQFVFPSLAAEQLLRWGPQADVFPDVKTVLAMLVLLGTTVVLTLAAAVIFKWQDLARE
ncbi:MAG TPA: hypothetical protein VN809_09880 [Telmatospirillum sp.]|nr:hypothetical protein [Telmatospirillum sp.]